MTQNTPVMKMTRRYGRTVYEVAAYCSPDSKATYEDRLLQLLQRRKISQQGLQRMLRIRLECESKAKR